MIKDQAAYNFVGKNSFNLEVAQENFQPTKSTITLQGSEIANLTQGQNFIQASGSTSNNNLQFRNSKNEKLTLNFPHTTSIPAIFFQFDNSGKLQIDYYKNHNIELYFDIANECYLKN